jgi:peptidoglycan-associated lipoprotein
MNIASVAKNNKPYHMGQVSGETQMNTNSYWKFLALSLCLALVLTLGVGCKHKKGGAPGPVNPGTTLRGGSGGAGGDSLPDASDQLFGASGLKKVYFDFDKSDIRGDQLTVLSENIDQIKKSAYKGMIQIAGHCDERGTQEYNLALGERRALSIRDFMIKNGIEAGRLTTISYGKEQPADPGHGEASWSKNRRGEFNKAIGK